MSAHSIAPILAQAALLAFVVLCCWLGVIGMWRMREPTQALHYLSLPSTVGVIALVVAVGLADGPNQAFWKTLVIACIMLAINSVVTHATARAFRARDLGHWEPCDGDPIEFVRDAPEKEAQ